MSIRKSLLLAILLLLPATAYAQEASVHPIDKALDACTDKDSSTAGMVRCNDRAYAMWDKELNKNYTELMRKLSPAGKQLLKAAQLEWLRYRDAEFKLVDSIYDGLEGTMYIPMRIYSHLEIVKKRALELSAHLDLLSEGGK